MNFNKILCFCTSALFAFLFYQCHFQPEAFSADLGLEANQTFYVLIKRVSMFMLGISVLMLGAASLPHSSGRQAISLSMAVTLLGLACTGTYEWARGTVNSSIWIAIIIESILGFSFTTLYLINLKKIKALA